MPGVGEAEGVVEDGEGGEEELEGLLVEDDAVEGELRVEGVGAGVEAEALLEEAVQKWLGGGQGGAGLAVAVEQGDVVVEGSQHRLLLLGGLVHHQLVHSLLLVHLQQAHTQLLSHFPAHPFHHFPPPPSQQKVHILQLLEAALHVPPELVLGRDEEREVLLLHYQLVVRLDRG